MRPASAIARRALADSRVRTGSFAALLAIIPYANAVTYRRSYPTLAERIGFARSFGSNKAVELFYGVPHDLLSVGGYTAWRLAGAGSIVAAAVGLLAAVRALRTEEDSGRQELVLAGTVSRTGAYLAALSAVAAGAVILWLAIFAGLLAGALPVGASAFLALATVSPLPVFAGVGALASQLAPTRRLAIELSSAALTLALLLRVVADIAGGLGWLRWATPLGWTEELRPFAGPAPAALLPTLAASLGLLVAAGLIARKRDVGTGLLHGSDSSRPRLRLLSSPLAQALRSERGPLSAWLLGTGLFAVIVGILSTSFTTSDISPSLRRAIRKLGGASITTPAGAIGFYFLFFVLTISLYACSQVSSARREEAEQLLETLLALPVSRTRWFGGKLALAAGGATALALLAGGLTWAGAASQNAGVSLPALLEAGANCLPAVALFLGLGLLAFALVPRASSAVAYGLVSLAFFWELLGALLDAPHWLLELSPFQDLGLVPAEPFRLTSAAVMLALAALAAASAGAVFRHRDLVGG